MRIIKKIILMMSVLMLMQTSINDVDCITYNQDPKLTSAYLLMEADTGMVLEEENGYTEVPVGTMNKLMTVLLVAEAIDSGEVSLNTIVSASSKANEAGGAGIWLMPGEQMSVRDLLKGVIIGNANDASVALAEAVGHNEENFVMNMNSRAFDLGMRNTAFYNSSGYGTEEQYSTAYDLALLCRELVKHDFLREYMTCWLDYIRGKETELVNENKLVKNYNGIIGFKAGHSEKSGNCLAVGAKRNGSVYIAVVLGYSDKDERFDVGKALLGKGFSSYQVTDPSFSNEHLKPVKVNGGVDFAVEIQARELQSLVVSKGNTDRISSVIFLPQYITAPVKKGQSIGKIAFYIDDAMLYETDLVTVNSVDKMTVKKAFKKIWLSLLK